MIYSNPIIKKKETDFSNANNFSLEIALKPVTPLSNGFNSIVVFHDGNDGNQLLLAQWRSWIIVMNGDDYVHKRKTDRIAVDTSLLPEGSLFFAITSSTNGNGTKLYCNGKLIKENKNLTLTVPNSEKTRLIVGNSVYGKHSWEGEIFGLVFYRATLNGKDIELHFDKWSKEHNFSFAKNDKPFALYLFNEKDGKWVLDHADGNHHLNIPYRIITFKRKILEAEWEGFEEVSNYIQDYFFNLLGFIPLGFSISATLIRFGDKFKHHLVLKTVFLCFLISIFIEIVQAWIPSRNSSMSDLVLNTLGALMGAIICSKIFSKRIRSIS